MAKKTPGQAQAEKPKFVAIADRLAGELDADILFYNAGIERHLDQRVIEHCAGRRRRPNVVLILVTSGGDADAAYRISACLQRRYARFTILVPGYCKSAGTLIALGANELAMSEQGELGPLDVQLVQKDELGDTKSGLTAASALSTLHVQAFKAFENFLVKIKGGSRGLITTKTATDIAVKMTCGLFSPIYQQVDPMHVGEAGRSLGIARDYGRLLAAKSLNLAGKPEDSLEQLVSHYPSHSFIIDRDEAKKLFKSVRPPSSTEDELLQALGAIGRWPVGQLEEPIVQFISSERPPTVALKDRRRRSARPKESRSAAQSSTRGRKAEAATGTTGAVAQIADIKRRARTS